MQNQKHSQGHCSATSTPLSLIHGGGGSCSPQGVVTSKFCLNPKRVALPKSARCSDQKWTSQNHEDPRLTLRRGYKHRYLPLYPNSAMYNTNSRIIPSPMEIKLLSLSPLTGVIQNSLYSKEFYLGFLFRIKWEVPELTMGMGVHLVQTLSNWPFVSF